MKRFCFRFDVDTHLCISKGMPKRKQGGDSTGYYRTPGLADFLRLWRRRPQLAEA